MPPEFLLDTGPLAAFPFSPSEGTPFRLGRQHHLPQLEAPFITCEPVIVEAYYVLSKSPVGADKLAEFCESGALQIDFRLLNHAKDIRELMHKYRDLPMDLADACLVLLAEQHPQATVITTDRDFLLYRTRNRRQIRLLAPFSS